MMSNTRPELSRILVERGQEDKTLPNAARQNWEHDEPHGHPFSPPVGREEANAQSLVRPLQDLIGLRCDALKCVLKKLK